MGIWTLPTTCAKKGRNDKMENTMLSVQNIRTLHQQITGLWGNSHAVCPMAALAASEFGRADRQAHRALSFCETADKFVPDGAVTAAKPVPWKTWLVVVASTEIIFTDNTGEMSSEDQISSWIPGFGRVTVPHIAQDISRWLPHQNIEMSMKLPVWLW